MLSKALIVGQYQTKPLALARHPDLELTVVVPPLWRDERGAMRLEKKYTEGYQLIVAPIRWNGRYHLHFYPTIGEIIDRIRPDILHIDEEPYNFATAHTIWQARRHAPRARLLFFTWQNLLRTYPLPFRWIEQYVYRHSDYALAGNAAAVEVLQAKGFHGPIRIIPQFGVDPTLYASDPARAQSNKRFVVGFAGRLVPEKGAHLLIEALAPIQADWELMLVGSGPERARLEALAHQHGIAGRVTFMPWRASTEMPDFYRGLDVLVAPSISRPNWTEQFGRVLIEAMACAVPVIGSNTGEIPHVIGDAGILTPEGDSAALTASLRALLADPERRTELGARGRNRVLDKFTQSRIADETYAVYREVTANREPGNK
ncbi:MAG: glycosyltransferase family 4 protein [Anaerolineae bacterium]